MLSTGGAIPLPGGDLHQQHADVKAETDYCCTSSNGPNVVRHAAREFGTNRVIFFPDSLMGANLQKELDPEDRGSSTLAKEDDKFGRCEVHEKFTVEILRDIRRQYNLVKGREDSALLAHWECSPQVLARRFYGSTSQMAQYIAQHPKLKRAFLATECEMAANLALEYPHVEFVKSCNMFCQHMRRITLEKILHSLENRYSRSPSIRHRRPRAQAIDRMLAVPRVNPALPGIS